MAADISGTVLLLIDVQSAFTHPTHWGPQRSNPSFEHNIATLLSTFRRINASLPPDLQGEIIHMRHASTTSSSPLHPSHAGFEFLPYAEPEPGEAVLTKCVNSAFIDTELEQRLRARGVTTLVMVGLTADHCVSTTVRMAANLGVVGEDGRVVLVGDAVAAWAKGGWDAETVHAVHLESLRGEFCDVLSTEEVLELLEREE